jgi:hypothetical protein
LSIEFDAAVDEVDELRRIAERNILIAHAPVSARQTRHVAAPDPETLFHLRACMTCDYPLTGLPRDNACPECGWQFEHAMFELDGEFVYEQPLWIAAIGGLAATAASAVLLQWTNVSVLPFAFIVAAIAVTIWWKNATSSRRFKRRVLITGDGVEIWRGERRISQCSWDDIAEFRRVRSDVGRLRLAMWDHRKWSIRFSSFFETWRTLPPGPPIVDVLLNGSMTTANLVVDEVERRREAAHALLRRDPASPGFRW